MTNAQGIDVSAIQGAFNWNAHKGIGFAGIRVTSWAGETFGPDPDLKLNANNTWDLFNGKVSRLYYHETRPGASAPDVQAGQVLAILGRHLCLGDMIGTAMEDTSGLPAADVAAWHGEYMHHLRLLTARQHKVLAYCNPAWCQAGNAEGLGGWPLWLADYTTVWPTPPAPWARWDIWQNSGTGLDHDIFNGDTAALYGFAGMPAYRQ